MSTFLIGTVVFALMALAVRSIIKTKKSGKGGCGCSCNSCPGHCHDTK